MSGPRFYLVTLALCLCIFMMVLDYSIANVCVPYIAGDLGTSNENGTWVITMFAVGNAIALPLTGWMTGRFGEVFIMAGSTLLFTIVSFLCGASPNLATLVTLRFIQGYTAGPLIALSQSMLLRIYPPEKKNVALALWGTVALVGPILGPIIGGWIVLSYKWSWIFYINIPVGIFCAAIIWFLLKEEETPKVKKPIDIIGMALLASCVTCIQIILDKGQQYDWWRSNAILALTIIAILSFIYFIIWEKNEPHPIVDHALLRSWNFSLGCFLVSTTYAFIMGAIVITPLFLQQYMGYLAFNAGLAVAPMGIIPLILSITVPFLLQKTSARNILALSYVGYATAFFVFSDFTTAASFGYYAGTRLILGVGILFWLTPLVALSMAHLKNEQLASASGIFHFFRLFMGGVGASVFTTFWQRRTYFHHHSQIEYINDYMQPIRTFLDYLGSLFFRGKQPLQVLDNMVDLQASMLAVNDLYWVAAWFCTVYIFMCFLFKKRAEFTRP